MNYYAWMMKPQPLQQHEPWLAQQLQQNSHIMIVCDGSYHPEKQIGTSSWVVTSINDTSKRIFGSNIVPGDSIHHCSHRSELCGIIGAVYHMKTLCNKYNISQGRIELRCDGLEACRVAQRHNYTPTTTISHFDMSSTLHILIAQSPCQWTFNHVKGHQDDHKDIISLDIWGQLNVIADAHAKMTLWEYIINNQTSTPFHPIPTSMQGITCNSGPNPVTIISKLKHNLHYHLAQQIIMKYWKHKNKWNTLLHFDTDSFHHAANNIPYHLQIWLAKWLCGVCGVGIWLQRWKEQPHAKCPRCLTDNETVHHVVCCPHYDATLCWNAGIEELSEWMTNHYALPGLAEAVCLRLSQWRNNQIGPLPNTTNDIITELIDNQDTLGWDALCFGAVHETWSIEQTRYLTQIGKAYSGKIWVSKFIRQVWNLQHRMWTHRNEYLHKDSKSIHEHEQAAVDEAIRFECSIGRDQLPREYQGLFRENPNDLVQQNWATKLQWLHSVWAGRDRVRREQDLEPWQRNQLAANFIHKNRIRKKRKRGIG